MKSLFCRLFDKYGTSGRKRTFLHNMRCILCKKNKPLSLLQ